MHRRVAVLALLALAGCASPQQPKGEETGPRAWLSSAASKVSSLTSKGEGTTIISGLKPGGYEASSLAIGEEKDLAQHRAEALGFVRVTAIEQYLRSLRAQLVEASGTTGVPGRVVILANPALAASSVPDGNLYVSMGWLENLENEDEVAAILAHELSHVLLKHHSADLVATMQHKAQALHEIGVSAKAAFTPSKTVSKSDARALTNQQLVGDLADKLALPAWNRRQEREADLLGVDLLIRAGYAPGAMVTMLEKLQGWEKQNKESDDAFWDRLRQTAQTDPGEAMKLAYQRAAETVSVSHPKTEERIGDVAEYLERHYGDLKPASPKVAAWKEVASRPDAAQVLRNYDRAFSARKLLDKAKHQEAYTLAKSAATGRTATDAYPNWVLARSAMLLGRQREGLDALQRAISSAEPVSEIYEAIITAQEQAGNIGSALQWTEKASTTFGGAPRWIPTKIRLLRKAGRTADAGALTLNCSVSWPDWRRLCQQANDTPAGRSQG
jgi:beta-barrel assembly-enhancing protease